MPAGVGVERLLRAVAVVRVVVDDQDVFAALRECGRRDGDVVEQAEPHGAFGAGVVTGRTQGEERGVALAGGERVGGGEPGAGRPYRGRPRAGRHGRVEIDGSATVLSQRLEALDVSRRVHPRDLLDGRVARRERRHQGVGVAPDVARGLGDAGVHGLQPRRALGVPAAGIVVGEARAPTSSTIGAASRRRSANPSPRYPACSDETALPGRGATRGYARASPCRP